MLPRLPAWLLLPLCLSPAGACDEEDPLADLEEFRAELGEAGRSRVVIGRMYQGFKWTLENAGETRKERIDYVCKALGPLYPTYVSGLVRLGHQEIVDLQTDKHKAKREEMIAVFEGVKDCLRENADAGKRKRPRFDIILNALHYTAESKGVDNKFKGDKWLMDDVEDLDELFAPNGYFFDFFSDPFVTTKPKKGEEAEVFHEEVITEGIPKIQKRGRFVGGNMLKTYIPKGSDFIAFTDRGLYDQVKHVMGEFDGKKIPVLMHIRNDPHCVGSEGRIYIERKKSYRLERLHQHVKWERQFEFTYMYPVFFPLYPPSAEKDPCDKHGEADEDMDGVADPIPHAGAAFDATLEAQLYARIKEYMGKAPKLGEPLLKKQALSNEDAAPTPYDLLDEGMVPVHRADDALGVHHYSASIDELEIEASLALTPENYFVLARDQGPGTVPLRRCDVAGGSSLLTTASDCVGLGVDAGALGFVGTSAIDVTVPLHHLSRLGPVDHLYTTSAVERDAALAEGYTYEGVAGYVWDEYGNAVLDEPDPPPPPDEPDPPPPPDEPDPPPDDPPPAQPCDAPLQPVYRGYHTERAQHLFAVNHDELLVPNMTDEGVPFQLKAGAAPGGWRPLYRCLLPEAWHLLTVDPNCEGAPGAVQEGVLGNVALTQLAGTLPVRRYFRPDPDGNDYLYILGADCTDIPNFTCAGIMGYVCPPP